MLQALTLAMVWSFIVLSCGPDNGSGVPTITEPAASLTRDATNSDLSAVSPFAQRLVEAFAAGDNQQVRDVLQTQRLPCIASEQTSPDGPPCRDGDAEGTIYETLWVAVCQPGWAVDIDESVRGWISRAGAPYALAQLPSPPDTWPTSLPYGDRVLVFAALSAEPANQAVAVYLSDDAIVRVQNGCLRADQFIDGLTVLWQASS